MKNIADVYRLSPRQHDLLELRRRLGNGATLAVLRWSMRGPLDLDVLERAGGALTARHPALRTALFTDGLKEPMQVVREKVALPWERADWSDLAAGEREECLRQVLEVERRRGFALSAAPLARFAAIRLAEEHHHFVFSHDALVLDERAARLCLSDLLTFYQAFAVGREPALEPAHSYREYIAWLDKQEQDPAEAWFRDALSGGPPPALLAGAPLVADGAGVTRVQRIGISIEATGSIQALLRQHRLSLGAMVQGAWAALVGQRTGTQEVRFGAGVSGRPATLARSDAIAGCFAGTLPVRVVLPAPGAALLPWLKRLAVGEEELTRHERTSIQQARAWAGEPNKGLAFESATVAAAVPDDALARSLGASGVIYVRPAPECPLLVCAAMGTRLVLSFTYDARRFGDVEITNLAAHLAAIVEAIAERPDQRLDALPGPEPAPSAARPLIAAVLAQHPAVSAVAVSAEGPALSIDIVPRKREGAAERRKLAFSLFYFADATAAGVGSDKYRIYLEGAKFADRNGFEAVWTPERHFHDNGGLYPNPSVLNAALATITERVKLRAGSVVVPIHHPLRIAEEWSVVDNLSNGRVGVSVASGWVPNDFAFAPENYAQRREAMFRGIEHLRALWAGGTMLVKDGAGNDVALHVFPRPIQHELPLWLTAAGNPDTFEKAGELGFNVLTSLLAQSIEDAAEKIALYRAARARAGHDPATGVVTMMVHAFVGTDAGDVLAQVQGPFTTYLRSHVSLLETMVKSIDMPIDLRDPKWLDYLASFAFERYSRQSALLGTPTSCLPLVERLRSIGVDEVACLVDFGVDAASVIAAFEQLNELRRLANDEALCFERVLTEYLDERLPEVRGGMPLAVRIVEAPARVA
jgi:natural product biosynthesis luciferase-like monooxygenase protein